MLTLRKEQLEKFREVSRKNFIDRMLEHLQTHFPEQCDALGLEGVRVAVAYGIERARMYGFRYERHVCKYIDVMFAYGRHFDVDPNLRWANQILIDRDIANSTARINKLMKQAILQAKSARRSVGQ